jgi:hypothetical protein
MAILSYSNPVFETPHSGWIDLNRDVLDHGNRSKRESRPLVGLSVPEKCFPGFQRLADLSCAITVAGEKGYRRSRSDAKGLYGAWEGALPYKLNKENMLE